MTTQKEAFDIGSRVRHVSDTFYNEGVVVWKHTESDKTPPHAKGKHWNVHWSNGKRGIYSTQEIQRVPPKNIKKIVESLIAQEEENNDEEK